MAIWQRSHCPAFETICCQFPVKWDWSALTWVKAPNAIAIKQKNPMTLRNIVPLVTIISTLSSNQPRALCFGTEPPLANSVRMIVAFDIAFGIIQFTWNQRICASRKEGGRRRRDDQK